MAGASGHFYFGGVEIRILIIRDELKISEYVLESMLFYNLNAEIAGTIQVAESLCLINRYDIIVVCSASAIIFNWLKKIRVKGISIPVIQLTFIEGVHDLLGAFVNTVDYYVVAPYDADHLYLRIRESVV
jgi:DNA-binding response OmpR family regulator